MQLEIKKCAELEQSFKFEVLYTCQPRVDNIGRIKHQVCHNNVITSDNK